MKIQCSCGTKYSFDVTPEMVAQPVKFVCQNCGADNSAAVNQLIQTQFGTAAAAAEAPAPPPQSAPPPPKPVALRVSVPGAASQAASPSHQPAAATAPMCGKHPGNAASEHCKICGKPICPKCMELFGYVCSAFCKNEAETRGMALPAYAGQSSALQARSWRAFRLVSWGIVASIAAVVGLWSWYSFSLSRPHAVFSVRFDQKAATGNARFITRDDAIVLRAGRLVRFDLKGKRELWHADLVDTARIAQQAAKVAADEKAAYEKMEKSHNYDESELRRAQPQSEQQIAAQMAESAADAMRLHVRESNVWVQTGEKLVRVDYQTGKPSQEVPLPGYVSREMAADDGLVLFSYGTNGETATRVDLTSGQIESQRIAPSREMLAEATPAATNMAGRGIALAATNQKQRERRGTNRVGITTVAAVSKPGRPASATGPSSALRQFKGQREPTFAENIASPAIAAAQVRNEQVEAAMADDKPRARKIDDASGAQVVNVRGKLVVFSTRLLEEKFNERQAMKAAPKKSALDGEVNQAATAAIANEILNDWQREKTGGIEIEDVSRYEVSLKQLGADKPDWTGEVTGPPQFFPLKTVNLLAAGRTLSAFDQSNRKIWEAQLNYAVPHAGNWDDEMLGPGANAPAIERDKWIFFRDAGTLICFDLATGMARWRLPSVGVSHMLFDDQGMLYAETTTAPAEKLKYSQQVDVRRRDQPLIIKVDGATGKLLWKSENNGRLAYISGKIIYTLEWMGGEADTEPNPYKIGVEIPPHVRIRRLSASSGKVLWEHYQSRAPVDVVFHDNQIELLFRKEFQVLRFWSL